MRTLNIDTLEITDGDIPLVNSNGARNPNDDLILTEGKNSTEIKHLEGFNLNSKNIRFVYGTIATNAKVTGEFKRNVMFLHLMKDPNMDQTELSYSVNLKSNGYIKLYDGYLACKVLLSTKTNLLVLKEVNFSHTIIHGDEAEEYMSKQLIALKNVKESIYRVNQYIDSVFNKTYI